LPTDDLGYFGPDSVTWRVHAEPVTMVGGLRALLLQALHPAAMRLLYEHSHFQDDTWARFQHTIRYVATVAFAPRAEVDAAAAHVRAVHAELGVVDGEQLAWVHACLVESFLAAASAAGLGLSAADRDRYVAEQVRAARLMLVPNELTPRDEAGMTAFLDGLRPTLALTPEARQAARFVVFPPLPLRRRYVLPARIGWTTISSLAVGLLPDWALTMYRLPLLPGRGLATTAGMRGLRRGVAALPPRYREGPMYRAAKARAAALEAA
jgi:uncharacterized protein (DUF2236 family)